MSMIMVRRYFNPFTGEVIVDGVVENVFCATGKGGGIDPTCGRGGAGGRGTAKDPTTPPPPGSFHIVDVMSDDNGDGVTDSARVGVCGTCTPPPPRLMPMPNLTADERAVEKSFMDAFHDDPDGMATNFRTAVVASAKAKGEPPVFGTDDAKELSESWSGDHMSLDERSVNRAIYNVALHQTSNAVAKRAFRDHLDTLQPGDEILVTVGGVGAGKGYALKNVPQALDMKNRSKAVWDSAGDQNATENPWVQQLASERGLKVNYVYVQADPKAQWAHPDFGVVSRAKNPADGRMVDADVFADSYAIGARNHQAFFEKNRSNPNASFTFIQNGPKPKQLDGIPKEYLSLNRTELANYARSVIVTRDDVPAHIRRGATLGTRIWATMTANEGDILVDNAKEPKFDKSKAFDDSREWREEVERREDIRQQILRSGKQVKGPTVAPKLKPDGGLA